MTAIILAAGRGSRMENYTANLPKSLLRLHNKKTILDYNISMMTELGVQEIYIVVGYKYEKIINHIKHHKNVSFIYNPFWNNCNVLGSFFQAFPFMHKDTLFLHADTLVELEIWDKLLKIDSDIVLPYKSKKCGDEEMKVYFDNFGKLKSISKTQNNESAKGEFLGIAKFNKRILPYIKRVGSRILMKGNFNSYMEVVIEEAIKDKKDISTFDIGESKFVEVDFEEDYNKACELFSKF